MTKYILIILSGFLLQGSFASAFQTDVQECKKELLDEPIIKLKLARKGPKSRVPVGVYSPEQINSICLSENLTRECLKVRACNTCGYIIKTFNNLSENKNTVDEKNEAASLALDEVIQQCKTYNN